MKKISIILALSLLFLIILLLIAPIFLKPKVLGLIQRENQKYANNELFIETIKLSMFRSFPYLHVSGNALTLIENNNDTIAYIPRIKASLNPFSLGNNKEVKLRNVEIYDAHLSLKVDSLNNKNWNITRTSKKKENTNQQSNSKKKSSKDISIKNISLKNTSLEYSKEHQNTLCYFQNINLIIKGDLIKSSTTLDVNLKIDDISYYKNDKPWAKNWNLEWSSNLNTDLNSGYYEIIDNQFDLNNLKFDIKGNLHYNAELKKYTVDFSANCLNNNIADLVNLFAENYPIDPNNSKGNFILNTTFKGEYDNELPFFDLNLNLSDAQIQFLNKQKAIKDINTTLNINNSEDSNGMLINLSQLNYKIDDDHFTMNILMSDFDNPYVKGELKGKIDFINLKNAFPLNDTTLNGIIDTDIKIDGKYSEPNNFTANGNLTLESIKFKSKSLSQDLEIRKSIITIHDNNIDIKELDLKTEYSDLLIKGKLSNYLPYLLKNDILKGNISVNSQSIEFKKENKSSISKTTSKDSTSDNTNSFKIPDNLEITINTDIKKLSGNDFNLSNIKGEIYTSKGMIGTNKLQLNFLNSTIELTGKFTPQKSGNTATELKFTAGNLELAEASKLDFIKKSLPIINDCNGKISTEFEVKTLLDKKFSPISSTLNCDGNISTQGIVIRNQAFDNLSGYINSKELENLTISSFKMNYKIENGNITIPPFKTEISGNPTTISGKQTVNGELNYLLEFNIKRQFFGESIESFLKNIPGTNNIKSVDIDLVVTGTLDSPEVKPDFSKILKSLQKEAGKGILKGLEKLFR